MGDPGCFIWFLSLLGVVTLILGVRGFTRRGLPVGLRVYWNGPLGKAVGLLLVLLGLLFLTAWHWLELWLRK